MTRLHLRSRWPRQPSVSAFNGMTLALTTLGLILVRKKRYEEANIKVHKSMVMKAILPLESIDTDFRTMAEVAIDMLEVSKLETERMEQLVQSLARLLTRSDRSSWGTHDLSHYEGVSNAEALTDDVVDGQNDRRKALHALHVCLTDEFRHLMQVESDKRALMLRLAKAISRVDDKKFLLDNPEAYSDSPDAPTLVSTDMS